MGSSKKSEKKEDKKVEFRYETNKSMLPVTIAFISTILLGNSSLYYLITKDGYYFMLLWMAVIGILIALVLIKIARSENYRIEVKDNSLIYYQRKKCIRIALPCRITKETKGKITAEGNRVTEKKIIINGLEFNASDEGEDRKTIEEFLEEVNRKALMTSRRDSIF